jgi:acetyltransferase-like isoleucine patch superfamily enzyme
LDLTSLLERAITRLKGRTFTIDRGMPLRVLLTILLRRAIWLLRGLIKTATLTGRPRPVFMGPGTRLRNLSMCGFGKGVTLETGVILDGLSTDGIHLGDNVSIGAYSQIRASGISQVGFGLRIGNKSSCDSYSFFGAAAAIVIGENVIMGQHVSFHAQNHIFSRTDVPIRLQGVTGIGITIEDDCWIGSNVVFLDGCHIGEGCVIAAGAVVRGTIPPFSVVGGVPAKVLRSRIPSPPDSGGEHATS